MTEDSSPEFLPVHPDATEHLESLRAPAELLDGARDPNIVQASTVLVESAERAIPNLGDALLFTVLAGGLIFLAEATVFGAAIGFHLLPHETTAQMVREPKLVVPAMVVAYLLTLLAAALVFPLLWRCRFLSGIQWNAGAVGRLGWRLPALGFAVGLAVQLLENYMPMPKTVPMDEYFKTRPDVWIVTAFGILLAPAFEEIAFRGMMLPAIGNAWDWVARRASSDQGVPSPAPLLERGVETNHLSAAGPSQPALIFSSVLTSAVFALLHADQLGHSISPLILLFSVSLVLTAVRLRTSSVAASALVHASYNFSIFFAMFLGTGGYQHLERLKS